MLRPLDQASMLPPQVFHDPALFDLEREWLLSRSWRCVAHARDLVLPGTVVCSSATPGASWSRDLDGALHAFSNVCTHRGALLMANGVAPCRHIVCPYHRWVFGLDGKVNRAHHLPSHVDRSAFDLPRFDVDEWQGFIFVRQTSAHDSRSLVSYLDDLVPHLEHLDLSCLRRGRRTSYEVSANWKLLLENFAESHHFPSVHPELERLTPSSRAGSVPSRGPWQGGTMEILNAETVSSDGLMHGRSLLPGLRDSDTHRVRDFLVWPTLLMSIQPDYLLTYRLEPIAVVRTRVIADIYFAPTSFKASGLDANDVFELWDRINAQDVRAVEQQQIGISASSYLGGSLAIVEDGVHCVETMIARSYRSWVDAGECDVLR
ncbi:MAG: aromatic ring-hydroxylating dioxygenase subunit alpha [Polyangiaceae bacterium]